MNTLHQHEPSRLSEKILVWAIRVGLILALFAPVVFNGSLFFPYIVPRAFYFQIVTEVLLALTVILMVFFPKYRPRKTKLNLALALFFAISVLATLTSADPLKSFIGTIERSFGLFHVLHFGFLYLAADAVLTKERDWFAYLSINIILSLYISIDFLMNSTGPSLMGNPTFLAAYLIFNFFFALHLISKTKILWLRSILAVAMALQLWALLATNIRGALVGLVFAAIYLFIYGIIRYKHLRVPAAGLLIIAVASYLLVFLNRDTQFVRRNYVLSRVTDFSVDATVKSRFAMWKMAYMGFKERPLLGWGRENYSIVFNTHYSTDFEKSGVGEGWEDRAHNVIFDELVNGGIVELLAYVFLVIIVAMTLRKNPILMALLLAYIGQNLFGVDTLNSYLPLFIFLAFVNFLSQKETVVAHTHNNLKPYLAYSISAAAIVAIVFVGYISTVKPAMANRHMANAFRNMIVRNYDGFKSEYEKSKELSSLYPALQLESFGILGSSVLQTGQKLAQEKLYLQYSMDLTKDLAELHDRVPGEQRWSFVLGQIYIQSSIATGNPLFVEEARKVWEQLLARSPGRKLFIDAFSNTAKVKQYFLDKIGTSTN